MSPVEMGYYYGYEGEKAVEAVLLSKGTSVALNGLRGTTLVTSAVNVGTQEIKSLGAAEKGFSKVKIPKGFKQVKDFGYQHGQKVYKYKGKYYSRDIDGIMVEFGRSLRM
jgi:hypothetical protein